MLARGCTPSTIGTSVHGMPCSGARTRTHHDENIAGEGTGEKCFARPLRTTVLRGNGPRSSRLVRWLPSTARRVVAKSLLANRRRPCDLEAADLASDMRLARPEDRERRAALGTLAML